MKKPPLSSADEARIWASTRPEIKYDVIRNLISKEVDAHFERLRRVGQGEASCPHEIRYINAQIQALYEIGDNLKVADVDCVYAWLWPLYQANRL